MDWYVLEGHEPRLASMEETNAQEHPDRVVAKTDVGDDVEVSTVFPGLDHRHFGVGPPVLFETMVFGGPHDQEQQRYCTWAEAELGHMEMVEKLTPTPVIPPKGFGAPGRRNLDIE